MDRRELFEKARIVVVKVGSAVLTDQYGLDFGRVGRLADQIARLMSNGKQVVLVSSGAVASGMAKAGLGRPPRSIPEKQACAALGQSSLIQAYEQAFARHGRKVAQILLTAPGLNLRDRFLNARNTLLTLMDWGMVPVINENDTVVVDEIKLGDNDNLAAVITNLLGANLMVNLTNVDGLFEEDPRENPEARLITLVDRIDQVLEAASSANPGSVGRGGIFSKVRAAEKAARCGAHTIVANGEVPEILDRLANGEELGTLFIPHNQLKRRKHWIAFMAAGQGAVHVDEGAVKPLTEKGRSLLAIGIRKVEGEFAAGEAVKVLGPGEVVLGIGLINYPSGEVRRIMGLRSDQFEQILGHKDFDEVIHRDNLVIFGLEEEESLACLLKG